MRACRINAYACECSACDLIMCEPISDIMLHVAVHIVHRQTVKRAKKVRVRGCRYMCSMAATEDAVMHSTCAASRCDLPVSLCLLCADTEKTVENSLE